MQKLKRKFVIPAIVVAVTFLLFQYVLFIGYVPTDSMEPTLHKGSFIIGNRIWGELKVGDIVVFRHEGKLLVKRTAATGGDFILHKGILTEIPRGHIYVVGDNKRSSFDSVDWQYPFVKNSDDLP